MQEYLLKSSIITIFPEMFPGPLFYSIIGNAFKKNICKLNIIDLKDYGIGKHKQIDDEPYGGGNGMLFRPDTLEKAIEHSFKNVKNKKLYYMSAKGKKLNNQKINQMISDKEFTIICGRFEGIDERIIEAYNAEEISVCDSVLAGGEIAAMLVLEACIRLLPGVVGNESSLKEESYSKINGKNILEYPQYTRPRVWNGLSVPDILLSGNHKEIQNWKESKSLEVTKKNRPDLIN